MTTALCAVDHQMSEWTVIQITSRSHENFAPYTSYYACASSVHKRMTISLTLLNRLKPCSFGSSEGT